VYKEKIIQGLSTQMMFLDSWPGVGLHVRSSTYVIYHVSNNVYNICTPHTETTLTY